MANDLLNGAKLIIDEMKEELENKKLPKRDRLYLTSGIYQLTLLSNLRSDVETLKKHDLFSWATTYPKVATAGVLLLIVLSSVIDWAAIRKPIIQGLIKLLSGIDLPTESIP